jgi:hypothetical protein
MKNQVFCRSITILTFVVLCSQSAPVLLAQVSNTAPTSAESPASPVQLQAGAWEVLNLVRAHVGDEVVIAYIKNSGKAYNLGASEILYLRGQGLSDPVLAAMLSTRQSVSAATVQVAPQPAVTGATSSSLQASAPTAQPAPAAAQPAPVYQAVPVQSAPTYVPTPVYVQPSPVYVYPSPAPYYLGPPGLSLSFGFGFGGGGYHGGYHGHH